MTGAPTDIPMDAAGVLDRARQRAERLARELTDHRRSLDAYAATADASTAAEGLIALDEAAAAAGALLERLRLGCPPGPAAPGEAEDTSP